MTTTVIISLLMLSQTVFRNKNTTLDSQLRITGCALTFKALYWLTDRKEPKASKRIGMVMCFSVVTFAFQ